VLTLHMACLYQFPGAMRILTRALVRAIPGIVRDLPFVVAGDFNLRAGDAAFDLLTTEGLMQHAGTCAPTTRTRHPEKDEVFEAQLDHVLYSKGVQELQLVTPSLPKWNETLPSATHSSDHLPVTFVGKVSAGVSPRVVV